MNEAVLIDRCAVLEAENDELRERVLQLEHALTGGYDRLPVGGLTPTEAAVLASIAASDEGAPKARIYEAIYALRMDREAPEPKIVDVFICKIRKKLVVYGISIETVWGWGYRMPKRDREALAALREAVS